MVMGLLFAEYPIRGLSITRGLAFTTSCPRIMITSYKKITAQAAIFVQSKNLSLNSIKLIGLNQRSNTFSA